MERNREGRRSGATTAGAVPSVTRRPRVRDASDDEDRMDDAVDSRVWERSKKERLATFHVSASINARNKRKRPVLPQDLQAPGGRLNAVVEEADDSVEETEAQVSEDDDEPPPPPLLRRPAKARVHSKEDEIVMDIPAVPRKARSSMSASSRYSSIARRQPEPQPPELLRQKSATPLHTPLNGSSSPNFLQKQGKKLKPVGPKVRAMKVPKVAEASTLSDQEAEVAEALFDLARSIPSHSGMLESKMEVKLESEARTGSPPVGHSLSVGGSMPHMSGLHHPGNTSNGYLSNHLKDLTAPTVEAPKRKRPRVVVKSEDGKISTPVRLAASGAVSSSASPSIPSQPCVGETQRDSLPEKAPSDLASLPSESLKIKAVTDAIVTEDKKVGLREYEGREQGEFISSKEEPQNVLDTGEIPSDRLGEAPDTADAVRGNEGSSKSELVSRPVETLREDGSTSKFNIDLMASPLKHLAMEEDVGSTIDKQNMGDNSSIIPTVYTGQHHVEEQSQQSLELEDAVKAMDVARGLSKLKEKLDAEKQEVNEDAEQQVHDRLQKEHVAATHISREDEVREKDLSSKTLSRPQEEVSDNAAAPPFLSSTLPTATSSSAPVALAGWMGGLPQLGYYGPGGSPWAAQAPLPNPGLDVKAAHTAMQLPHGPILSPVPRMKRCATHVFMAHFIYREQQVSRHSIWSAALCRAAPYNLNIPPVNILDNDKLGGHYLDAARKASAPQSGPSYGYTISQGVGPGIAGSSSSSAPGTMLVPNHTSNAGGSGDTGNATGTGTASNNVMAAHAQYLQAMMQQNGFASFPFPFNGPPSQAAQFFNSHFFPPHLIPPPLPHMQPLPQQSGNVLPVQKQQQGVVSLPHSNSSQHVAPPLQQQLQLQLAPQSPSQSQQQHNHVGVSAQQFGIHSDKESTAGAESASTADSRLSAMQRSMSSHQGPSNLPNLNINASLMLGANLPGMPSHDQDGPSLVPSGGKQSGKGQQQFQGQSPASLSSPMQPQQFSTGAAPSLQMKVLDPMLSQGYSSLARGPVNPGSLGLVSSMMGTPSLGVLPGSVDGTKGPGQQQPVYGGHGQHFQRSMPKAPSASDDAYALKVRDYAEEKKNSMKPVGGPPLLSRVDMEVSSPSLQGSPPNGSGAANARTTGGIGRSLNSTTPPDARSSRPASSSGSGQVPLLQNQPQKQAMGRAKSVSGSTNVGATLPAHSVAAYAERALPGNLGKFPGTGLPFSGQMAPTSQTSKPGHSGVAKGGQRVSPGPTQQQMPNATMTKSHVQQTRGNQPGVPSTPPRMLPSVTAPVLSGGTIPMSTSHSLSASKASTISISKSPSNGKGSVSMTKAGPPTKKTPVSGPGMSSVVSSGQNASLRAPNQHKSPASAAHGPQFPQQQSSVSVQQQRLATTKNQVYPQLQPQQGQFKQPFQAQSAYRPQLFLQQHQQQYMQHQLPSQQQQAVPQHTQVPVSHHYPSNPQNSSSQHSQASQQFSHLQQQFQTTSSQPMTGTGGLTLNSSNLTLGTMNMSNSASSDGGGSKGNPTKTSYVSGNPASNGAMPEVVTTAHSTVSGQVSSPHNGSSSYLQLPPVKPNEQKAPDVSSREDMTSARHLASPSSSQTWHTTESFGCEKCIIISDAQMIALDTHAGNVITLIGLASGWL
ncbi:hypothetical protein GOP47_0005185 [Adiantum capillus-veneris]|uniref:Uncharacterized protein n=1 Tax=Adiantum capillus-veneris TaxID=13818 RepID=A0A9D4ZND2_ADICA|nr:hypothetical protein GOP47_0005185 [Adiantum capillus-veneris]